MSVRDFLNKGIHVADRNVAAGSVPEAAPTLATHGYSCIHEPTKVVAPFILAIVDLEAPCTEAELHLYGYQDQPAVGSTLLSRWQYIDNATITATCQLVLIPVVGFNRFHCIVNSMTGGGGSVRISLMAISPWAAIALIFSGAIGGIANNVNLIQIAGSAVLNGGVAGSLGVGGTAADDSAPTGRPLPVGGRYQATPTTITDGDIGYFLQNAYRQVCPGGMAPDGTAPPVPVSPQVTGALVDVVLSSLADGSVATLVSDAYRRLHVRPAAYDEVSGSDSVSPTYTVGDQYNYENEFIDTTNLAVATYYYPSSAGLYAERYNLHGIHIRVSAQVRLTLEVTNDDSATPDWEDITTSVVFVSSSLGMVASGMTFFSNANGLLYLPDALFARYRLVANVLSATNSLQAHFARRSM